MLFPEKGTNLKVLQDNRDIYPNFFPLCIQLKRCIGIERKHLRKTMNLFISIGNYKRGMKSTYFEEINTPIIIIVINMELEPKC